jgi:hypothetical protein
LEKIQGEYSAKKEITYAAGTQRKLRCEEYSKDTFDYRCHIHSRFGSGHRINHRFEENGIEFQSNSARG